MVALRIRDRPIRLDYIWPVPRICNIPDIQINEKERRMSLSLSLSLSLSFSRYSIFLIT